LRQIADALEAEKSNTEKFRNQLAHLLAAGDQGKLLERLSKGSDYYKNILLQNLEKLLFHNEEMKEHTRVKTYLNQLADTDVAISKKIEEVDKASLLVSGILHGEEKFDFTPLRKLRAEERSKMLARIRKEVASMDKPAKAGKPPKEKKAKKKKDGPSTFDTTLQMLNNGMTVEQIAAERQLAKGTIESHLARAVEAGTVSIYKFMDDQSVTEITKAIQELPDGFSSKDLFAKLKGKFGYNQLRATMAHVKTTKS
jgi:hypothetical protein